MSTAHHNHGEQPAVIAQDLSLRGEEGPVFGPLNFEIPARGLNVLTGTGGSGRTALALVIAGRMKPSAGSITVLGYTNPKHIAHHVAIAGVDQIDLLDRSVTVRDILTEDKAWSRPWYKPLKKATQEELEQIAGAIYGARDLPPLDAYISQISALDKLLLRIALALHPAHGGSIHMLVMDDLDQVREIGDRAFLVNLLARISEEMPVVINTVNPLPPDAPPHRTVELDTDAGHYHPEHDGVVKENNPRNQQQSPSDSHSETPEPTRIQHSQKEEDAQ